METGKKEGFGKEKTKVRELGKRTIPKRKGAFTGGENITIGEKSTVIGLENYC
jgi:hypothetical protein